MNNLIKIDFKKERPTVSARDLHEFLEVPERFSRWFERMTQYGIAENVDFHAAYKNVQSNQHGGEKELQDYELTIDAAKQICMLQRNEKGRQARLYFIDVEKRWNNPEMIMARALKMADNRLHLLEIESKEKDEKIKEMEPKALFADAVSTSETTILIGELAKILKGNGIDIGQNRLFQRLREDGFLIKRKGMDYNMPTQVAMEKGLFRIKETAITHSDGHVSISKTTKVTGKGQQYFVNYF